MNVGGRDIPIHAVAGGTLFYAEEEYTRPITSRADVPESLKCLCELANDRPLGAGADEGVPGKSWLTAQAKYAAQVMRDEGLAGLPIIVRPFHEHTGSWFWWGQPYWNCAALLGEPGAVSGPDAYKAVARTFITALRSEPGMESLVFAYSPDRLLAKGEEEPFGAAEKKVMDPVGRARDQLRERIVRELEAAGLAYVSPAERATTLTSAQVGASPGARRRLRGAAPAALQRGVRRRRRLRPPGDRPLSPGRARRERGRPGSLSPAAARGRRGGARARQALGADRGRDLSVAPGAAGGRDAAGPGVHGARRGDRRRRRWRGCSIPPIARRCCGTSGWRRPGRSRWTPPSAPRSCRARRRTGTTSSCW